MNKTDVKTAYRVLVSITTQQVKVNLDKGEFFVEYNGVCAHVL